MLTLITLPNATTILSDVGAYSVPFVTDLMPLVYLAGGIALAFFIIGYLISVLRGH